MKKFNLKKVRAIVGVCLIMVGIIVFTGGKPNPTNPNIIDPAWQTMLVGGLLMFFGWWIGRKDFKDHLYDLNIRGLQYNVI